MFIAALFTIVKIWKQLKCPSTEEWIEYYLAIKKNEILPFATTWMDLEGIMLSEIYQTKTNTVWYHLYVEPKKETSEYNKVFCIK